MSVILQILIYGFQLLAYYYLLSLAFKVLKIPYITSYQIIGFMIGVGLIGTLANSALGYILPFPTALISNIISYIVLLAVTYLFGRWYLKLEGKKLLQLVLYFFLGSFLINYTTSFIARSIFLS